MLQVRGVQTFYGASQALYGVDLNIRAGEVVTLLGRNGMGKTTLVRSIIGLLRPAQGSIRFEDRELVGLPSYAIARAGVGLVPEGRQIFPNLTVQENLLATACNRHARHEGWTLPRVYELFPRLSERANNMGNQLSGGEQQMLAIARALMTNPTLLILDEATEGLAPMIRQEIWSVLEALKAGGESILVIDKNLDVLLRLADRHFILEKGLIVWEGSSTDLADAPDIQARHLGV